MAEAKSEITKSEYWLDHATESGTRHFIIHGPLPKGLNADWGYPICDSMNRHHCISPEEDEANGKLILHALNCRAELLEALRESLEQLKYLQAFSGGTIMTHIREERLGRVVWQVEAAIAKAEGGSR